MPSDLLKNARDAVTLYQAVENAPTAEPQQIREDPAQPQAVVVQRLLRVVADAGVVGDDIAPVAALLAQFEELARGHVTGPDQADPAHAGQHTASWISVLRNLICFTCWACTNCG